MNEAFQDCADCRSCATCKKFQNGDRIELSIAGILNFGSRMVTRGTVRGQERTRVRTVIVVHWDGYPEKVTAKVNPEHLQQIFGKTKAFI